MVAKLNVFHIVKAKKRNYLPAHAPAIACYSRKSLATYKQKMAQARTRTLYTNMLLTTIRKIDCFDLN